MNCDPDIAEGHLRTLKFSSGQEAQAGGQGTQSLIGSDCS